MEIEPGPAGPAGAGGPGRTEVPVVPIAAVVDEGLGNSAYLVDLGDGRALAVDASRDLRALRREAGRRGLEVAFAADTHLHADFLTGALDLAAAGARVLASAAGNREFPHRGLRDGDEVDLGGLTLRALATPGHTEEHLSFLLLDGSRPVGVFTGGSLLVGAAARTDLAGPDRAEALAREQWRSLQRLITLPDATGVWPTHGAGSFCSAPPGAARTSTIGAEKAANPLLRAGGEDAFVAALLAGLGSYPPYFARLGEANRRGPAPLPAAPALPPSTSGWSRGRCRTAPAWSTCAPSPATPPVTYPARCPSRCARRSPPGWAGPRTRTCPWSSSATTTRTPRRSSGRR